ncbi:MAG: hypothetical protein EOP49_10290 [Sphingobacteriales bacterium]|nr:MAG: hypothetical protein EOP49_10290 [Sphingobacteriales bacterium]
MKNLKTLMLGLLLVVSLAACKKEEDEMVTEGSMSAKIDSKDWTAGLAVVATKSSGVLSIAGTGNGGQVNLNLLSYSTPGTFQLGGTATNPNHAIYTSTTLPPVAFSNMVGQGSGTLVITSEAGGFVEGTFSFTAKNPGGGTTVTVTDGKFRAKIK